MTQENSTATDQTDVTADTADATADQQAAKDIPDHATLIKTLTPKVRLSRILTIASYTGLLALFVAWYTVLAPVPDANPWVIIGVQSALLLAFLPTIISGRPRGHAWLCFIVLVYFTHAVLVATNPNSQLIGLIYSGLTGILFTAAMYYTRWKARLNKALAGQ
ncbi:MAG: DUF2069 domain-containing protein [Marinobacterium sp.]|nr:DUF2069 domain-containing protein [Marinobacterium sp.]